MNFRGATAPVLFLAEFICEQSGCKDGDAGMHDMTSMMTKQTALSHLHKQLCKTCQQVLLRILWQACCIFQQLVPEGSAEVQGLEH